MRPGPNATTGAQTSTLSEKPSGNEKDRKLQRVNDKGRMKRPGRPGFCSSTFCPFLLPLLFSPIFTGQPLSCFGSMNRATTKGPSAARLHAALGPSEWLGTVRFSPLSFLARGFPGRVGSRRTFRRTPQSVQGRACIIGFRPFDGSAGGVQVVRRE